MEKKHILIIEDETPMAKALSLKMEKDGIETVVAHNGQEGIDQINAKDWDLIICDLMMPGVDGFAVLEHIQSQKKETPVIVASNLSQAEDIQKARDLGARDYFVKSDTPIVSIVSKVKAVIGVE